jgi:hypothetical protein
MGMNVSEKDGLEGPCVLGEIRVFIPLILSLCPEGQRPLVRFIDGALLVPWLLRALAIIRRYKAPRRKKPSNNIYSFF